MTLDVEHVEPGVARIRMSSVAGRVVGYDASAYVLDGIVVDTGFRRAREAFGEAISALGVRAAVITHWHEDHAGNVPMLARSGMPMVLHPGTEAILRAPPDVPAYRRIVWGQPEQLEGDVSRPDTAPLRVIHAPGHTADHQVVWHAERGIIATGDLFLGVKVRHAHRTESPRMLVQSLRMVAALEPRLLLDAHRGVIENPVPLVRAKIDWLEETYHLVFGDAVEFDEGHVTMSSPIGRALLGKAVGEVAFLKLPTIVRKLEITRLRTIHDLKEDEL